MMSVVLSTVASALGGGTCFFTVNYYSMSLETTMTATFLVVHKLMCYFNNIY